MPLDHLPNRKTPPNCMPKMYHKKPQKLPSVPSEALLKLIKLTVLSFFPAALRHLAASEPTRHASFSYLGARPCRRPPKSFTPTVFSRFWGSGAGKKDAKIIRCFWKSILDRFEPFFEDFDFFCCAREATIVKYNATSYPQSSRGLWIP